jgi:hypothetical protein
MNSTLVPVESIVPILQTVLKSFYLYSSIFILVPGFFLNTLTFLIFLRKKFWTRTTMGFYYCTSTAISQYCVVVGMLSFFPVAFNNDLLLISDWSCKIIWLFRTQGIVSSSYFQVFITVDLTLNTLYHNRFQFLKKYKNLALVTFLIQLVVALSNTAQFWRFVRSIPIGATANGTVIYSLVCILPPAANIYFQFVVITSRMVPAVSNFTLNFVIIYAVLKSKRAVSSQQHQITAKDLSFAVSLVAQNFIFFVLTLPTWVIAAIQIRNTFTSPPADYANTVNLFFQYFSWSIYILQCMTFAMNYWFNKIFRAELRLVFSERHLWTGARSNATTSLGAAHRRSTVPSRGVTNNQNI